MKSAGHTLLIVCLSFAGISAVAADASSADLPEPSPLVLLDPEGDVSVVQGGPGLPPEMTAQVDITEVRVYGETPTSFHVAIVFAGLDPEAKKTAETITTYDLQCRVSWSYNNNDQIKYILQIDSDGGIGSGDGTTDGLRSRLDRQQLDADPPIEISRNVVGLRWDQETHHLSASIPKDTAPAGDARTRPTHGDLLTHIHVTCLAAVGEVRLEDTAPDGTPTTPVVPHNEPFAFTDPGQGKSVTIDFRTPDADGDQRARAPAPALGVQPGVTTLIPIQLINHQDEAARATLDARVIQIGTGSLPWSLILTPEVVLIPGEVRIVNLLLEPTEALDPAQDAHLEVDARVGDELGRAGRPLLPALPLSPDQQTLYFHADRVDMDPATPDARASNVIGQWKTGMTTVRQDPAWPDDPVAIMPVFGDGHRWALPPLARPLTLSHEEPVRIDLGFTATTPVQLQVEFTLLDSQGNAVVHAEATVSAPGSLTMETFAALDGPVVVLASTQLQAHLRIGPPLPGAEQSEVFWLPAESNMVLPIIAVPVAERTVTDGRFAPGVELEPGAEGNVFMNPGGTYAFPLWLSNDGASSDRVTLRLQGLPDGWTHTFLPGSEFLLLPGNGTAVGVELKAPANVPEFEVVPILVQAGSKNDADVGAKLPLQITVTRGVELPDVHYDIRPEAAEPVEQRAESPAPPVTLFLLLVLGALARNRVRRGP